ncbi:3-isopropylmalate dehydratase small subunit [Mediterraneibacter sp. NSJ-55]|uniref:3-isopropylmalate dehydratase n=1 Tax=Mediterraneibacter hominis TaxID=2763054 RepID=A0A923RSG8_9FIRM|nr:3-isopropylmalate dehydratase small subunit [Mediterraneibacter hominis]MBC5689312.1 3-isopropylmalate dehydratase small subunit [Mediterraneibacter hominis]
MEKLTVLKGKAVPWLVSNVDTDTITPMKRLLLNMDELEKYSFEPYRFLDGDGDKGELNKAFPLNQVEYQDAKIMITGVNFGCGSSRETAPEAIRRCGIRCLIGSSFGGIFQKNCFQQGVLPITFPEDTIEKLAKQAETQGEFIVDLERQKVVAPDMLEYDFQIEKSRKDSLLYGMDDVDMTLRKKDRILQFFEKDLETRPWLYNEVR